MGAQQVRVGCSPGETDGSAALFPRPEGAARTREVRPAVRARITDVAGRSDEQRQRVPVAVVPVAVLDDLDDAATTKPCAYHPSRPAADACPVCQRGRCAEDVAGLADGCRVCGGRDDRRAARPPVDLRAVVGATVACHLSSLFAAAVVSQYVGVKFFALILPAFAGVSLSIAAERGAGGARGPLLRVVAVGYAIAATMAGHKFVPGGSAFSPLRLVGPPVLVAAAAAWFYSAPPKPRPAKTQP